MLDGYTKAEERGKMTMVATIIKNKRALLDQETKIRESVIEETKDADHKAFLYVFDKWRMLAQIIKMKEGKCDHDSIERCV
jgi:rRNA maturation endonuclease Nob1